MNAGSSHLADDPPETPIGFSLVLGGPLFQLLRRAHLAGDAVTTFVLPQPGKSGE